LKIDDKARAQSQQKGVGLLLKESGEESFFKKMKG